MKNGKNGSKPGRKSSLSQQELTREEEYELFERIKNGDKRAEALIVEAHYGFMCDTASRYNGPDKSDLVQEGSIGMLVAIKKFDHTRGIRFMTYAGYWIRAYMVVAVKRHYRSNRPPGSRYEVMRDIRKEVRLYANLYGRFPTIEELSGALGMKESTIVKTLNCDKTMTSIGIARDDADPLGWRFNHEVIPDSKTQSPLELVARREREEFFKSVEQELREALKQSSRLERDIDITFAHLLDDTVLSELGRKHNISRERVRQIKARSIRILRHILSRRHSELSQFYQPPPH